MRISPARKQARNLGRISLASPFRLPQFVRAISDSTWQSVARPLDCAEAAGRRLTLRDASGADVRQRRAAAIRKPMEIGNKEATTCCTTVKQRIRIREILLCCISFGFGFVVAFLGTSFLVNPDSQAFLYSGRASNPAHSSRRRIHSSVPLKLSGGVFSSLLLNQFSGFRNPPGNRVLPARFPYVKRCGLTTSAPVFHSFPMCLTRLAVMPNVYADASATSFGIAPRNRTMIRNVTSNTSNKRWVARFV